MIAINVSHVFPENSLGIDVETGIVKHEPVVSTSVKICPQNGSPLVQPLSLTMRASLFSVASVARNGFL